MPKAILCLDDEPMILNSIRGELQRSFSGEFDLEIAESADEALEILEQQSALGLEVVAVVSDWLMPGMKGDEFLAVVHHRWPQVARLLLTGFADQETVRLALAHNHAACCLSKPWSSSELALAIRKAITDRAA